MRVVTVAVLGIVFFLLTTSALALWSSDPASNTPVCTLDNIQNRPQITQTSGGDYIVLWGEFYPGYGVNREGAYAQRLSDCGGIMWQSNGVELYSVDNSSAIGACPDDTDGAFVAWNDYNNDDVYVQRIDIDGAELWTPGGVALITGAGTILADNNNVISDGLGGVFVHWRDFRAGNLDPYVQRVDADGNVLWTPGGVALTMEPSIQEWTRALADGSGGVMVGWVDGRNDPNACTCDGFSVDCNPDIYAQRVLFDGTMDWAADGIPIVTAAGGQIIAKDAVPDGAGGVIFIWQDFRNDSNGCCFCGEFPCMSDPDCAGEIWAQRVDVNGNILWAVDGRYIGPRDGTTLPIIVAPDGAGGAFLAWIDSSSAAIAQRIDNNGNTLWGAGGIVLSDRSGSLNPVSIVPDGFGGAIIAMIWAPGLPSTIDLVVQRVDSSGALLWGTSGTLASSMIQMVEYPKVIADGIGGAVATWKFAVGGDIYVQRIRANGTLGGEPSCPPPPIPILGVTGHAILAALFSLILFIRMRWGKFR